MHSETYWPPKGAMNLIRSESAPKSTWEKLKVQVLRFYDTFIRARQAVPKFCNDSQYETESEALTGKGQRLKFKPNRNQIMSSSDEEEAVIKISKQRAPSPPPVRFSPVKTVDPTPNVNLSSAKPASKSLKRKKLVDKQHEAKKAKEAIKAKVEEARAIANARMSKPSPVKLSGMTSPWKVDQIIDHESQSAESQVLDKNSARKSLFTSDLESEGDVNLDSPMKTSTQVEDFVVDEEIVTYQGFQSSDEFQSSVLEKLENLERMVRRQEVSIKEVSKKSDLLLSNTMKILRTIAPGEKRVSLPEDMPKLPLDGKKAMNCFEKFLKASKTNEVAVMDHLSNFIVRNSIDAENKSVRSILTNLMVNSLAELYNLDGGGVEGKEAFRSLKVYEVLKSVLVTAFDDICLPVLDTTIGSWLTNAKWRDGGSKHFSRKKGPSTSGAA